MIGSTLAVAPQESDLGVIVDSYTTAQHSKTSGQPSKKGNNMLGIIKKATVNKTESTIMSLCKTMMHPHVEYSAQFEPPHLIRDIQEKRYRERQQGGSVVWRGFHMGRNLRG